MSDEPRPADEAPPDLRFSEHVQRDVQVRRDLSGQGHLARGDKTRMSRLDFSARARPADPGERDPEFVARERAGAGDVPAPPAPEPAAPVPPPEPSGSLLERLGRWFGR